MKTELKFYVCKHCGNIATKLYDSGVQLVCCGEQMAELVSNTVEASLEKHIPAYTMEGDTVNVQVGSVLHPMLAEHYIGWVCLHTENGPQFRMLKAGDEPKAVFTLQAGEKAISLYAWCNLHGLWKVDF